MAFLNTLFSTGTNFLYLVFWLLLVLIAFTALAALRRQISGQTSKPTSSLPTVHETTQVTVRQALSKRQQAAIATNPKSAAPPEGPKPVAVIRFDGDTQASSRRMLARLIDEAVTNKDRLSGVVVVVNSPGGGVAEYGACYSEMERLRTAGIHLVACVDAYAASGGYLMSLPANRIIANSFSLVGSIGVVSEMVNVNKLLKQLGVEPYVMTAGARKRTMTTTGKITDDAKAHYQSQLEAIHRQFTEAVVKYRGADVAQHCTGDHWTAGHSVNLKLNLIDELATSQEYLLQLNREHDLLELSEKSSRLQSQLQKLLSGLIDHLLSRLNRGGQIS